MGFASSWRTLKEANASFLSDDLGDRPRLALVIPSLDEADERLKALQVREEILALNTPGVFEVLPDQLLVDARVKYH